MAAMYSFNGTLTRNSEIAKLKQTIAMYESEDPHAAFRADCNRKVKLANSRQEKAETNWRKALETAKNLQSRLSQSLRENRKLSEQLRTSGMKRESAERKAANLQELLSRRGQKIEELQAHNNELKKVIADKDRQLREKQDTIDELQAMVRHLEDKINRDGTDSGTPTSQTPRNKKKVIPNLRPTTGNHKGGQPGHAKSEMPAFDPEQATDTTTHELKEDEKKCSVCGGDLIDTGRYEEHQEVDFKIVRTYHRHLYKIYQCANCGTQVKVPVDARHTAKNQYGSNTRDLILSLAVSENVPINKIRQFLCGLFDGRFVPCEGYIAKQIKRAAKDLQNFKEDLRNEMLKKDLLYWDDTVIFVNTKRACLRFYGDDRIAYYTAHEKKNLDGVREDGILSELNESQKVMHDHYTGNYNREFRFRNVECNQHLERDAQRNTNDTGHTWSADLKDLIGKAIHDRNKAKREGSTSFPPERIRQFNASLDQCLAKGDKEHAELYKKVRNMKGADYGYAFEGALLNRLRKYRRNYFHWIEDFSIPTTNSLSERSLRGVKSKMKVSGQFESVEYAQYYATLRSYVETCRRNGWNEMNALKRLTDGNPVTVKELFHGTESE